MRRRLAALGVALAVLAGAGLGVRLLLQRRAAERLAQGERLYRLGASPSGRPVKAVVAGDLEVDAAMLTCVSCHLRSGYGSLEGKLRSPPISGEVLFAPARVLFKGVEVKDVPPRRPAYTRESLGVALRTGIDPAGRRLDPAMPRFAFSDEEVALLAGYLEALAPKDTPGVEAGRIHLATVVSAGAPGGAREAMRFALEKYLANKNAQTQPLVQGLDNRSARMAKTMLAVTASGDVAFRELALEVWEVQGPPATWAAQLERRLAARPVFALLGGLVEGPWAPVAAFADAHHLPALFPVTELPVASADPETWTVYLSPGAALEGAALAGHLGEDPVVQWVAAEPLARERAQGFDQARAAAGLPPAPRVEDLAAVPPGTAVVLWDAPEARQRLEALAALDPPRPLYASAVALGPARRALSARARERVRFTWPRRTTREERAFEATLRPWLKDAPPGPLDPTAPAYAVAASAYAAADLLSSALMDLRGHYTPEALLDVLGMMKDQRLPAFERLSFGQGQRYASKGLWLVEVDAEGELVARSEWLTR